LLTIFLWLTLGHSVTTKWLQLVNRPETSYGKIKIWENTFTLSNYQLICNIVFKLSICVMQCLLVDKNNDKIRIKKKIYTHYTHSHTPIPLRVCLGLRLRNRDFKSKSFLLSFCQKCVLAIFKLFRPLKALLIFFFLLNEYFFLQTGFLSIKRTFKLLKCNLKHALNQQQG
jgi:hypothetical protein